jgi:hypothetical protein
METKGERNTGLVFVAAGLVVVVLAVLLFGVTTDIGGVDWVSIITATAGAVMAAAGLYRVFRNRGKGPSPSGPRPHNAS